MSRVSLGGAFRLRGNFSGPRRKTGLAGWAAKFILAFVFVPAGSGLLFSAERAGPEIDATSLRHGG